MSSRLIISIIGLLLFSLSPTQSAFAEAGLPAVTVTATEGGGETYSLSIQALVLMTVLTLLPAFLLMMTSFTRVVIVLAILRLALGTAQTPSNQIVIGLALFLTFFIMTPVFDDAYQVAFKPYLDEQLDAGEAIQKTTAPFRQFMIAQTREDDIGLYANIAGKDLESPEDVPFSILLPAFVTSELKTAFQIGFLLFIPFLIIDLLVASVLMSMGMMMLSPLIISLPFKLMLFVLVDGWSLVLGTLAASFYT